MKKIVLFIIVSLGVILSLQSQEQTVYKPFWGTNITRQYYYFPCFKGFMIDAYPYQCSTFGINSNGRTGSLYGWYDASANESNSKLWDITNKSKRDSILIVDMDLAVGDSFEIVRGTKNVVTNVFWEGGLKHIQFDLSFLVESDSVNEDPAERFHTVFYEVVEGVGSLYPDIKEEWFGWYYPYPLKPNDKYYGGITVRGIWRDGSLFYVHPLWKNKWNYGDLSDLDVIETRGDKVSVFCEGGDLLQIRVEDSSSFVKLQIYDLESNLLLEDFFIGNYERSFSSFQRGLYIVRVNDEYTTKILLR